MTIEFWVPTILALVLAIWNFYQQHKLKKLEQIGEKQLHVHRLQFDKEFKIYSELWSKLVELRGFAVLLRPRASFGEPGMSYEEATIMRLNKTKEIGRSVVDIVENNKPFYAESVYSRLSGLLKLISTEVIDVEFGDINSDDYWKKGEESIKEIVNTIDLICEDIRNRIGLLRV